MLSRKQFLISSAASVAAIQLAACKVKERPVQKDGFATHIGTLKPADILHNKKLWASVRNQYLLTEGLINLNNGAVGPQPKIVREAHIANYNFCNEAPAHNMWQVLGNKREQVRTSLAALAGCSTEELAINRNTTEGLTNIIFGLKLKAGDEVVLNTYDYPFMINAWKQREARDGIKLIFTTPELPVEDDEYIVTLYEKAITAKTKIVHLTHIMNWTGQVIPVKKIADMAHSKGCEVVVDAAHSFGLLQYSFADLGADYAAASLHKWMGAPFGTGILYIKKEKIESIWPLMSGYDSMSGDIKKFETIGTRSFAAEAAVEQAITFQKEIGIANIEARLRFLKDYWVGNIAGMKKVTLHTSIKFAYSCGMATFSIAGMDAGEISNQLLERHSILASVVKIEKLNALRISPHIYTSIEELDILIQGIKELSQI